ncbi:alpha-mannosidase [Acidicapsa acidisoli]|uniref:alpha-mannosidase n=1 Tax=Acidicapsa acidisoli TaxID=1615681 RepID=UPI0021E079E5|nr:glycoside hydrolase family 38 C-terminal domain-containing protein [Acidicapsa acidisoli]
MSRFPKSLLLAALMAFAFRAPAQTMEAPDITKQPTLYVVPYAHLDTQWRWEYPQVISEYLLKTMRVNFDYIDKYPHYVFNWTGSNRYRLMKEYYPADYARLKQYVAKGNWYPAGSSVEEGDVNLPSAESIIRQVLYGNTYFRNEFGKASAEYMLPDCFGFPASLPTILAHAGVKGFSTQKLNAVWQPAPLIGGPDSPEKTPEGIPFNVGLWQGPDGETVIAALNPGGYGSRIYTDLSKSPPPEVPPAPGSNPRRRQPSEPDWPKRINLDGSVTGVYADYHYVGTGDIGGATNEESVKLLEATVTHGEAVLPSSEGNAADAPAQGTPVRMGDGPVHVISAAADQMFLDIKPEMQSKLPSYKGDLELINHSAGSLTSEAYHKRWNRRNEILADAAEKASIAASWMGGRPYPQQRLNDAWMLVMGGQFHDSGAGTATPRAYEFQQNDDVIALNQFSDVLTSATQSVASALDTQVSGTPVVVYNPLNIAREDVVEAALPSTGESPKAVRVFGPDGHEVPAQVEDGKVLFLAKVPSVGYAVYDIRRVQSPAPSAELKVSQSTLENGRYRISLSPGGDVTSIIDKSLNKDLLAGPMRLAISNDAPKQWPAWNMDFDQEQAAPRAYVGGAAKIRVVESGPVRIAVEVTRESEGSKFVQTVRLSAGDPGNRVEFSDSIDWRTLSANLKAVFPLSAANKMATYNWEIGTIQRPAATERQFEVASHHWIDQTDESGSYGATILTDVKNGSDKRDDSTIRLTLLRTPGAASQMKGGYTDQLNQDWGHHEILFGIAGHAGDWRQGRTDWQAYRLSTPLIAFETEKHAGKLGRDFSLLTVDNPDIRILALKKAELSDEVIVRLVELDGKPAPQVRVKFAGPIASMREVNGQELPIDQPIGSASVVDGALETSFKPYQPRTFALRLGESPAHLNSVTSKPVALKYDLAAASEDDTKSIGGFDKQGDALPAEMLPTQLSVNGVDFQLAHAGTGKPDALVTKGQAIPLPAGDFNKVYVLAASAQGDQQAQFRVGDRPVSLTVEDWGGFIGQWDTRQWKPRPDSITQGGGPNSQVPAHQVPLRKDWAVSANHATWDLHNQGSPAWSPRYPEDYLGLRPGYVKPATLAWYASHHHTPEGLNQPYAYSYLFVYPMDLPAHARTLTLPANDSIRILAISVAKEEPKVAPAEPLYDTLGRTTESNANEDAATR